MNLPNQVEKSLKEEETKFDIVYVKFSCGCIFNDKEDKQREKRNVLETKNGKRTNRIFCPIHPKNSKIAYRFKYCSICHKKTKVARMTNEGPCIVCNRNIKLREKYKEKKQKTVCLQYGKRIDFPREENLTSQIFCIHRMYCLSFFHHLPKAYLDCTNCKHFESDLN